MNKFLKEFGVFLLVMLAIALVINYRFGKSYYSHFELQYKETVTPQKRIDGIILGTSHGAHGLRPEVLDSTGKSFYNFAMNGGNPEFFWNWYTNIFRPYHPRPLYCIWATDWFLFDTAWVWRHYEQDSEYFPDSVFYANVRSKSYDRRSLILNRIPFTKYKTVKDLPNLFRPYDESQYVISKYKDGFLPYWPRKIEKFKDRYNNKLKDIYQISARQQGFFEDLVKRMQDDGIKLIMINTPEYGSTVEEYKKIKGLLYLDDFARKNNIPFLNYNLERRNDVFENKDLFTDWGHLGEEGSLVFSMILRRDLDSLLQHYR